MAGTIDLCEVLTGFPLNRVVVFDIETTGLSSVEDEILSISICDGTSKQLFSSLIKPTRHKSWPNAERVNGITPAMVKQAPTLSDVSDQIRQHLTGNKLIVGYNVSFDLSFLISSEVLEGWPASTFDVMREYALIHGSRRRSKYSIGYLNSKLAVCASSYGYEFSAHDATEDAKATAYCFRALLCDELYVKQVIKSKTDYLKKMPMGQIKATTQTVLELVESGVTSSVNAELRIGSVTRGKNKGAPRYECFIDDRCVGVSSPFDVGNVRTLYAIGEEDPLPKSIPCKALLSARGDKAHCDVTITARGKLMKEAIDTAEQARTQSGVSYRKIQANTTRATKHQATHAPTSQDNNRSRSPATKNKQGGGCLKGLAQLIIAVFFTIMLVMTFTR